MNTIREVIAKYAKLITAGAPAWSKGKEKKEDWRETGLDVPKGKKWG